MSRKELIYKIIIDIWGLLKKYGFDKLTDGQWEKFVYDGNVLSKKYKGQAIIYHKFCRKMIMVISDFYEELNTQNSSEDIPGQMSLDQYLENP
jgi:hypothetical protein